MSKIKVTLPGLEIPIDGKQVSFVAPCDCSVVDGIQIDGVDYDVVDSEGNIVPFGQGVWCDGAMLSVILDVTNRKAYLQNQNSYTRVQTFTSATAEILGLDSDAVPDDAFRFLSTRLQMILGNNAEITLTVKDTSGAPVTGVRVSGVYDERGADCYTNSNGVISGYAREGNVVLAVANYFDVADYSETIAVTRGNTYTKTITLTRRNSLELSASASKYFTDDVADFDVCAVGGGGGGGAGRPASKYSYQDAGGGGAGGQVNNAYAVPAIANTSYSVVVGAGGAGSGYATISNGGTGGTSSLTLNGEIIASATGGAGGQHGRNGGSGGVGNGNGGNGWHAVSGAGPTAGGNGTGYVFDDSSLGAVGGGGGGGNGGRLTGAVGGTPNGGGGGAIIDTTLDSTNKYAGNDGQNGTGIGGGGGGGNTAESDDYERAGNGGSGYRGAIFLRWRFKTA